MTLNCTATSGRPAILNGATTMAITIVIAVLISWTDKWRD